MADRSACPRDDGPGDAVVLLCEPLPSATLAELDTTFEADAISGALTALGWRVTRVLVTLDLEALRRRLLELRPRLVVNLVDGRDGADPLLVCVPHLLECLGLAFTGCGGLAMATTTDKLACKRALALAGVPSPAYVVLGGRGEAVGEDWPYIVKSVTEEGSVGIFADSVVHDAESLARVHAERRRRFGGRWFAERYIDGRELNVALLEIDGAPVVLGVSEMVFADFPADRPRIADFAVKWEADSPYYARTSSCYPSSAADQPLLAQLRRIGQACWALFDLRGYARVDFRVDSAGRPYVLEVNANPCLSPGAGFTLAAAHGGREYEAMIAGVVDAALARGAAAAGRDAAG